MKPLSKTEQAEVERLLPLALAIAGQTRQAKDDDELESVAVEALVRAVLEWRKGELANLEGYARVVIANKLRKHLRRRRALRERIEDVDLDKLESPAEVLKEIFPRGRLTKKQIAGELGVHASTLRRWIRKAGTEGD